MCLEKNLQMTRFLTNQKTQPQSNQSLSTIKQACFSVHQPYMASVYKWENQF